jgi:hypothetical protein
MLPLALSKVLGISLSKVMEWYFDESGQAEDRTRRIKRVIEKKRLSEEGEEWLAREARRMSKDLEHIYQK